MKRFLPAVILFLFCKINHAQIAGSFSVPGSFPTLAAAINTLNITGVAGAVTINVAAGYTETVPTGGLRLMNPPGSGTTTILFRKQGVGANPVLFGFSGGTALAGASVQDGIWMLVDCRNITIDAIDLFDPNTTTPATMEYGYALYNAGGNGNRNNTIKNCVITLGGANAGYTRGIEMACVHFSMQTTTITPSSTLMTNSYNTFRSNFIQLCCAGFSLRGSLSNGNNDYGNDIGGTTAATGNTVVNFGTYGGFLPRGIDAMNQFDFNASFNLISNNTGTATPIGNGGEGIYAYTGPNATINNNTITLGVIGASFNVPISGIRQLSWGPSTGTVSVSNNLFPSLTYTAILSGVSSNFAVTSLSNNISYVANNTVQAMSLSNGTVDVILATGNSTVFISNNIVAGATVTTNGTIRGITSSSYRSDITGNFVGNLFAPCTSTANYTRVIGMLVPYGAYAFTAANNTITNIRSADMYGMSLTSTLTNCTFSIVGNRIYDIAGPTSNTVGATCIAMLVNPPSTSGTVTIRSNTISNIYGRGIGSSQSQGGAIWGITISYGAKSMISQNKIYGLATTGGYGLFGMYLTFTNADVYNNVIGELQSNNNVYAVNINNGNHRFYYNSIAMSNTFAAAGNTGSSLLSMGGNGSIEFRNNILVNTSASTGTGVTCIFMGNNYSSSSNRNAFYMGTPGPSRSIWYATPSSSAIAGFQAMFNSDAQSFIENPPFASTVGSASNFLDINPTVPTQIESGAATISTITTDFVNTVRSNTPDIGAWEGNFIAADAAAPVALTSGFTGPPCNTTLRTFTVNITDASGVASGTLSPRLYYRVNFGLYTSVQGTLTSGTATNGVWAFDLSYSAATGDVIWYYYVVQDVSYLNNLRVVPPTGATVTSVNNVIAPPSPASNYTIQTFPTISVSATSGSVCTGGSFVIQVSGAAQYSYAPGSSATVTPTGNTTYTVSGASSLGCPSTNSITVNITTVASPSISLSGGSICAGKSFTLSPTGAISYTYQGGSAVVSPATTTNYTVVGANAQGCRSLPASAVVIVNQANIGGTANPPQVCAGGSLILSGSGASTYSWSGGVSNNVAFVPPTSSVYVVTGTTSAGCSGTKTVQVTVNPLPSLTLTPSATTVCEGEVMSVNVSGAFSYTWLPNQQTGPVYTETLQATTTVTVEGLGAQGCTSTATLMLVADPCLGIAETLHGRLHIFPNPTTGDVNITIEDASGNETVRVLDYSGRLLIEQIAEPLITFENLVNGVYLMEISRDGEVIGRVKVIKL
jgi:hypothetical protein